MGKKKETTQLEEQSKAKQLEEQSKAKQLEGQNEMYHATYLGPRCGWNITSGDTALLRFTTDPDVVLVQFDNLHLCKNGVSMAHGWHQFPAAHFKLDEPKRRRKRCLSIDME